jgi:hypothetical protein
MQNLFTPSKYIEMPHDIEKDIVKIPMKRAYRH